MCIYHTSRIPYFFVICKDLCILFSWQKLAHNRRNTPMLTAMSAILNTAKYFRDIISVTDQRILRSKALRNHPVNINAYPICSLSVICFHDLTMNISNTHKIIGTTIWIPGRGVLKATPAFLIWVNWNQPPNRAISGSCECDHHFVRRSTSDVKNMIMPIFILPHNTWDGIFSK